MIILCSLWILPPLLLFSMQSPLHHHRGTYFCKQFFMYLCVPTRLDSGLKRVQGSYLSCSSRLEECLPRPCVKWWRDSLELIHFLASAYFMKNYFLSTSSVSGTKESIVSMTDTVPALFEFTECRRDMKVNNYQKMWHLYRVHREHIKMPQLQFQEKVMLNLRHEQWGWTSYITI